MTEDNVLRVSYKKKYEFLASLKSLKKGVGSVPKCHRSPTLLFFVTAEKN
jgi:hypothetical protein